MPSRLRRSRRRKYSIPAPRESASPAKAHLHQPAFGQSCAICHEPHGGDNEHLLRAKGNALCLECHGPDSQPQKLESEHLITIFNGSVKLPDDYYVKNKVAILPLRYGLGHPVEGHPVTDVMDPANVTKIKTRMTCLTCQQHGFLRSLPQEPNRHAADDGNRE